MRCTLIEYYNLGKSRMRFNFQAFVWLALATMSPMVCYGAEANPDQLKVGLLPVRDASTVLAENRRFKEYLEKSLNKDIELVVTSDYSAMVDAMRDESVDVVHFGPVSYVLAQSSSDIKTFAVETIDGRSTYQAVLIANADTRIDEIADIHDIDVAYGDLLSTASHLIPKSMLLNHGKKVGKDYREHFLSSHDAVALAVQSGRAHVGGLKRRVLESMIARGTIEDSKVRVLGYSDPFPQYPWTMRNSLDEKLQEQIKTAFYELDDAETLAPLGASGMAPVDDADYDVVRELLHRLGL